MTTYMYKVTIIDKEFHTSRICLCQYKGDAENLVRITEEQGNTATLNRWQWKTEIEEIQ